MKPLSKLCEYRETHPTLGYGGDEGGFFLLPCKLTGVLLAIIASTGGGWDHVSVSLPDRCPTWEEMNYVKRLFFEDDECAVQYHPPVKDHISVHPFCLHMWRKQSGTFFFPPKEMIA